VRVKIRAEISRIQADLGVTTLYVTHDQVEAMTLGHRVAVIRDGLLQQVDTPQRLYDRPDNLFVAGFIGSPAMNLWHVQLINDESGSWLQVGDQKLGVPKAAFVERPRLSGYSGREVIVGIRPEDITSAGDDTLDGHHLTTTVGLLEALGSEILIHIDPGVPLAATGDPDMGELSGDGDALSDLAIAEFGPRDPVSVGDQVTLAVDLDRLHFFDAEDGEAIWDRTHRDPDLVST